MRLSFLKVVLCASLIGVPMIANAYNSDDPPPNDVILNALNKICLKSFPGGYLKDWEVVGFVDTPDPVKTLYVMITTNSGGIWTKNLSSTFSISKLNTGDWVLDCAGYAGVHLSGVIE